jgi:hypothetical protein
MKQCIKCGLLKEAHYFYKEKRVADGLTARCKACMKNDASASYSERREDIAARNKENYCSRKAKDKSLRNNYGITLKQWENIFDSQGCKCAICGSLEPNHSSGQFVVDHCHEFGQVRGILCGNCNIMLGQAKDDINTLFDGAMYLIQNSTPESIEERKQKLRELRSNLML